MDIDRFIKQDILDFLEKEQHKDITVKNVRSDEMSLYEIDKDYVKELEEQLKMNNIESAKELFDDLRKIYNRTPENDPLRRKIFSILKEMHDLLKKYITQHKLNTPLSMEIQYYDQKGIFIENNPPKKIMSELEEKGEDKAATGDGYNSLRDEMAKRGGDTGMGTRDLAEMMAREIAQSIPLEDSSQLRDLFFNTPQQPTTQIIQQIIQEPFNTNQNAPLPPPQRIPPAEGTSTTPSSEQPTQPAAPRPPQVPPPTRIQAPPIVTPIMMPPAAPEIRYMPAPPAPEIRYVQAPPTPQASASSTPEQRYLQGPPPPEARAIPPAPEIRYVHDTPRYAPPEVKVVKMPEDERPVQKTPTQVYLKTDDIKIEQGMTKENIKKMVEDVARGIIQKEQADSLAREEKRQAKEDTLSEKTRIDKEKETIKRKQDELDTRLEELKHLKLAKEELQLLKEKEKKEALLDSINRIIDTKKNIHQAILRKDIAGAKKEYKKIKETFMKMHPCEEKKKIYQDILSMYDAIKFSEQTLKPLPATPTPKEKTDQQESMNDVLQKLRDIIFDAKRDIMTSDFTGATKKLASAKETASHIPEPQIKQRTIMVIDEYQQKLAALKFRSTALAPTQRGAPIIPHDVKDQANLYLKGVSLLYGNQKQEAAKIFQAILEENPNNVAAKIRLQEAIL